MAENDDIREAIERLLADKGKPGAQVHVVEVTEHEFMPTDNDDENASTLLDRSIMTLDKMADNGMALAGLLEQHKRFITNVFGQLGALVVKNGGMVRLSKAELNDAMDHMTMSGTWDGDDLVLVAKKDTGLPS